MSEPKKAKSFYMEEQKNILVQGDADKYKCIMHLLPCSDMHAELGVVKNRKERHLSVTHTVAVSLVEGRI